MRITSVTLRNFRSYGPEPTTVDLRGLTAFVGSNGCGKTALLQALSRLFGVSAVERALRREDFHVPIDMNPDEVAEATLFIEARFEFPELDRSTAAAADGADRAVAECFRQMVVEAPGGTPFCRVRLEGRWTRGNLPDGDVDEDIYWLMTGAAEVGEEHKIRMPAHDRSRVHVLYVPAARDPARQIRQASGSLLARMLNAVEWSAGVRDGVKASSEQIRDAFRAEVGVRSIQSAMTRNWRGFHDLASYSHVKIQPVPSRLEEVVRQAETLLGPAADGTDHPVGRLSDGLRSLFYFALVGSVFDVEQAAARDAVNLPAAVGAAPAGGDGARATPAAPAPSGLSAERLRPPALTLFAVEEPENHLAPHYLARTMLLLRRIAASDAAQVVLTSHSASILSRVEPEEVRHFRLAPDKATTIVREITLPAHRDDAHKYIREAVRAYPELYFARFVVLGEGDSEEIALPRVAQSLGLSIDKSFVAMVPLGGRHVNHLWRLLNDLSLPHVTLLDLDREREGGGWGRVRYACEQLVGVGVPREQVYTLVDNAGQPRVMTEAEVARMHEWPVTASPGVWEGWLHMLERHGVFFSAPLDLDFMMLEAFPAAYRGTAPGSGGPRVPPAPSAAYDQRLADARARVLKEHGTDGSSYTVAQRAEFIWYSYLFLGKGKPSTHLLALQSIPPDELAKGAPPVLRRLIELTKRELKIQEEADAAENRAC